MSYTRNGYIYCAYCGEAYPDDPGADDEMRNHEGKCLREYAKDKVGYHDTPANPDPKRKPLERER